MNLKKINGDNNQTIYTISDNYEIMEYDSDDADDILSNMYFEIQKYNEISKQIYYQKIPIKFFGNQKKILCNSVINKISECSYGNKCIYAHSIYEQNIDENKKFIYQIILDENLMDLININGPKKWQIYTGLINSTKYCKLKDGLLCSGVEKKCNGGLNCKYGVHFNTFKICRCDLLMGQCSNDIIEINVDKTLVDKVGGVKSPDKYLGCMNGHHLTMRGLIPFLKLILKNKKDTNDVLELDIDCFLESSESESDDLSDIFEEYEEEIDYCDDEE